MCVKLQAAGIRERYKNAGETQWIFTCIDRDKKNPFYSGFRAYSAAYGRLLISPLLRSCVVYSILKLSPACHDGMYLMIPGPNT